MGLALKPNFFGIPHSNGFAAASVVFHGLTYFFIPIKSKTANTLAALNDIPMPTLTSTPLIDHKYRSPSSTCTATPTRASIFPPYALLGFILTLSCLFIGHLFIQKQFFLGEAPFGPPIGPPDPSASAANSLNIPNDYKVKRHGQNGGPPPPPPPPFLDTDCNPPKRPRNFLWMLICALAVLLIILWKQLYLRVRSAPRAASKRPSLRLPELHHDLIAFRANSSESAPPQCQIPPSNLPMSPPLQAISQSYLKLSAVLPLPPSLLPLLLPLQLKLKRPLSEIESLAPSKIEPLLELRSYHPYVKPPSNSNIPLPLPLPLQASRWQLPLVHPTSPFPHTLSLQPLPCTLPPWLTTMKKFEAFWSDAFSHTDIPASTRLTQTIFQLIFILLPDKVDFVGWLIWWITETIAVPLFSSVIDGRHRPTTAFWTYYHWVIIIIALSPMLLVAFGPFGSLAQDLADWEKISAIQTHKTCLTTTL